MALHDWMVGHFPGEACHFPRMFYAIELDADARRRSEQKLHLLWLEFCIRNDHGRTLEPWPTPAIAELQQQRIPWWPRGWSDADHQVYEAELARHFEIDPAWRAYTVRFERDATRTYYVHAYFVRKVD